MKFWTIQSKEVAEESCKYGYFPHISKSRYIAYNPEFTQLYNYIINNFNRLNRYTNEGVIFAFAKNINNEIEEIKNFDDFYKLMKYKKDVVGSFFESLPKDSSVILELKYDDNFNTIPIDYNDFQYIMPPFIQVPPYTANSYETIMKNINRGSVNFSEFPSGIMQVHLPNIQKDNIINIYDMIEI